MLQVINQALETGKLDKTNPLYMEVPQIWIKKFENNDVIPCPSSLMLLKFVYTVATGGFG